MSEQEKIIVQTANETLLTEKGWDSRRVIAAVIIGVAILVCLLQLYTGFFSMIDPYLQVLFTLTLVEILGFLLKPLGRKSWREKPNWLFSIDVLCILLSIAICVYITLDFDNYTFRVTSSTNMDYIAGIVGIVLLLEIARRTVGWAMVGLCIALFAIIVSAEHLPGFLYGPSLPIRDAVEVIWMQQFGVFGLPMQIVSKYLIVFLFLVALLTVSGAGNLFINIALAIAGRFSGGAAKVAIVASSMLGTLTGASVANVAGTGTFTIPMMKEGGYEPHVAGAVEAVASSGGQIMPPIMGTAAFLMAEFMGVSYLKVILAALIPAILYYVSLFFMVHYEGVKTGLVGIPKEECPKLWPSIKRAWSVILPLLVLVYGISVGWGLAYSGLLATVVAFVCIMINPATRLTPTKILDVFEQGGTSTVIVGIACAAAGIIIGCFWVSDLGTIIRTAIVAGSGGVLIIGLFWCAILSIILGMGLPTPMVYVTCFLAAIPALLELGADPMAANLFCFYFAIVSGITPPVCITAFVAAGIAGSPPMKTGFTAFRLGIIAYIVPFLFVLSPALVAQGSIGEIILAFITGVIGAFAFASGIQGWLLRRTNWLERILLIATGILILIPSWTTDLIGIAILALIFIVQKKSPGGQANPLESFRSIFNSGEEGKHS